MNEGYSRIPIHEPKKADAILGMLLVKKLITYDPEDGAPVSDFQLTPLPEASPDLTLLDCLNYFQQGRSHMILVSRYPGEARGALGIVTLEDVIEELIGSEIVDETDVYTDVHNKIRVHRAERQPLQTSQEKWQPLIRGIIERRRKFGGPTTMPLRNSFGIAAHGHHPSSGSHHDGTSTPGGGRYGSVGTSGGGGAVAYKSGSTSSSSTTIGPSGAAAAGAVGNSAHPTAGEPPSRRGSSQRFLSRQNTIESESGDSFVHGGGGSPSRHNPHINGAYLVEVGSHDDRPRIWGHADFARERISESPAAEARAEQREEREQQQQQQAEAAKRNAEIRKAVGEGETGADRDEEDGESRPLLSKFGQIFGGSGKDKKK